VRIEKSPEPIPEPVRPRTQESYEENLFDAEAGAEHSPAFKKTDMHVHPSPQLSKFHEAIDQPVAVSEAAADKVGKSSTKWEEASSRKEDADSRAKAVAKAVEAATAAPISP
jgi:hypothetical protein